MNTRRLLSALAVASALFLAADAPKVPSYNVLRAGSPITIDGNLDEPAWESAPSVGDFQFPWYREGKKEQTIAKLLWDDKNLYVSFRCEDAHISGVTTRRDGPVYEDDCVEVFTAPNPDDGMNYINLEMNVREAWLDDHHPSGPGSQARPRFNGKGIQIKTTVQGTLNDDSDSDEYWTLEAAIPLANYAHVAQNVPPKPGDVWRIGLNRCGGKTNEQFSQWSPSRTPTPQFHAPQDFGQVIFSEETAGSK